MDQIDLITFAEAHGIKYFLVNYTDLFGVQRAKMVPAAAVAGTQKNGASFAGFASWLDMSPADSDLIWSCHAYVPVSQLIKQPFVQRPRDFCHPVTSAAVLDYRTH